MRSVLFYHARWRYVAALCVAVAIFAAPVRVQALSSADVVGQTNIERSQASLEQLSVDERLTRSAQAKAQHLAEHDYWDHYAPDGTSPWHFMQEQNYTYQVAGENLARGFVYTESMIDAWMNSPEHRSNILKPEFEHIGVGITDGVVDGKEVHVVVVHYAQQKNAPGSSNTQEERSNPPSSTINDQSYWRRFFMHVRTFRFVVTPTPLV